MLNGIVANLSNHHGPGKSPSWKQWKNCQSDEGITAKGDRI